jgi:hypothetical protein
MANAASWINWPRSKWTVCSGFICRWLRLQLAHANWCTGLILHIQINLSWRPNRVMICCVVLKAGVIEFFVIHTWFSFRQVLVVGFIIMPVPVLNAQMWMISIMFYSSVKQIGFPSGKFDISHSWLLFTQITFTVVHSYSSSPCEIVWYNSIGYARHGVPNRWVKVAGVTTHDWYRSRLWNRSKHW